MSKSQASHAFYTPQGHRNAVENGLTRLCLALAGSRAQEQSRGGVQPLLQMLQESHHALPAAGLPDSCAP